MPSKKGKNCAQESESDDGDFELVDHPLKSDPNQPIIQVTCHPRPDLLTHATANAFQSAGTGSTGTQTGQQVANIEGFRTIDDILSSPPLPKEMKSSLFEKIEDICEKFVRDEDKVSVLKKVSKVEEIQPFFSNRFVDFQFSMKDTSAMLPTQTRWLCEGLMALDGRKWATRAIVAKLEDLKNSNHHSHQLPHCLLDNWNAFVIKYIPYFSLESLTTRHLLNIMAGANMKTKLKCLGDSVPFSQFGKEKGSAKPCVVTCLRLIRFIDGNPTIDDYELADIHFESLLKDVLDVQDYNEMLVEKHSMQHKLKDWATSILNIIERLKKLRLYPKPTEVSQYTKSTYPWRTVRDNPSELYQALASYLTAPAEWFNEFGENFNKGCELKWHCEMTYERLKATYIAMTASAYGPETPYRSCYEYMKTSKDHAARVPALKYPLICSAVRIDRYFTYLKEGEYKEAARVLTSAECKYIEVEQFFTKHPEVETSTNGRIVEYLFAEKPSLLEFIRKGQTTKGFENFPIVCRNDPTLQILARKEVLTAVHGIPGLQDLADGTMITAKQLSKFVLTDDAVDALVAIANYADQLLQKLQTDFASFDNGLIDRLQSSGVIRFYLNEIEVVNSSISFASVKRNLKVLDNGISKEDWESYVIREHWGVEFKSFVDAVILYGQEVALVTQRRQHELVDFKCDSYWWENGAIKWEFKIKDITTAKIKEFDTLTTKLHRASVELQRYLKKELATHLPLRLLPISFVMQLAVDCNKGDRNSPLFKYLSLVTGVSQLGVLLEAIVLRKEMNPIDPFGRCRILLTELFQKQTFLQTNESAHQADYVECPGEVLSWVDWWPVVVGTHPNRMVSLYELALPSGNMHQDLEQIDCILERAKHHCVPAGTAHSPHFVIVVAEVPKTFETAFFERLDMLPSSFAHPITFVFSQRSSLKGRFARHKPRPIAAVTSGAPLSNSTHFVVGSPRSGKSNLIQQTLKLPHSNYNLCCLSNQLTMPEVNKAIQLNIAAISTRTRHISFVIDVSPSPHVCAALFTLFHFRFIWDCDYAATIVDGNVSLSLEFSSALNPVFQETLNRIGTVSTLPTEGAPTCAARRTTAAKSYYDKKLGYKANDIDNLVLNESAKLLARSNPTAQLSMEAASNKTPFGSYSLPYMVVLNNEEKLSFVSLVQEKDLPDDIKSRKLTMQKYHLWTHATSPEPDALRKVLEQILGPLPSELVVTLPGAELMLRLKNEWQIPGFDPSVIVGSTGCGKTFHIESLAKTMKLKYYCFHVTATTILEDIETYLDDILGFLERNGAETVVCLFDEINSSPLIWAISSIIYDGAFPPIGNKNVAGRLQQQTKALRIKFVAAANPFIRHEDNSLVYAVQPVVPATVQACAVTMDELRSEFVRQVAESMVLKALPEMLKSEAKELGVKISGGWNALLQTELPVSLRTVASFLAGIVKLRSVLEKMAVPNLDVQNASLAVSWEIYFAYPACDSDRRPDQYAPMWKVIKDAIITLAFSNDMKKEYSVKVVESDELHSLLAIALLCGLAKIPLIIFGPPGTSKSLVVSLVTQTCASGGFRKRFPKLPALSPHYFQCSDVTSASSLKDRLASVDAVNKGSADQVIACACIDELSLAPATATRVINEKLDQGNISLLATSNFVVDRALFNRCVVIRRKPIQNDVHSLTALTRRVMNRNGEDNPHIALYSTAICETLLREVKPDTQLHENHALSVALRHVGCRDWYHFVNNNFTKDLTDKDIERLIVRDFGFGVRYLTSTRSNDRNPLVSSQIVTSVGSETWSWEATEYELSQEKMKTKTKRPMLIVADSFSVFMKHMRMAIPNSTEKVTFVFGDILSPSPSASTEQLLKLKKAMQQGCTTVLIGTEHLAESILDLLNAYYTVLGERSVSRISMGGSWDFWDVHPTFQIIFVQLPRDHNVGARLLSSAFFDRFERRHLNANFPPNKDNGYPDVDRLKALLSSLLPPVDKDSPKAEWFQLLVDRVAKYPYDYIYGYHPTYVDSLSSYLATPGHANLSFFGLVRLTKVLTFTSLPNFDYLSVLSEIDKGIVKDFGHNRLCLLSRLPPGFPDYEGLSRSVFCPKGSVSSFNLSHSDTDDVLHKIQSNYADAKSTTVIYYDPSKGCHSAKLSYNLFAILDTVKAIKGKVIVVVDISKLTDLCHIELEFHPSFTFLICDGAFLDTKSTIEHGGLPIAAKMSVPWWNTHLDEDHWNRIHFNYDGNYDDFLATYSRSFFDTIPTIPALTNSVSRFLYELFQKHSDKFQDLSLFLAFANEFQVRLRAQIATEILHPTNLAALKNQQFVSDELKDMYVEALRLKDEEMGRPGLLPCVDQCPFYFGDIKINSTSVERSAAASFRLRYSTAPQFKSAKSVVEVVRAYILPTDKVSCQLRLISPINGARCRHTSDPSYQVTHLDSNEFPLSCRIKWMIVESFPIPEPNKNKPKLLNPSSGFCEVLSKIFKSPTITSFVTSLFEAVKSMEDGNTPEEGAKFDQRVASWEAIDSLPLPRHAILASLKSRVIIPIVVMALRALKPFFEGVTRMFAERWTLGMLPTKYEGIVQPAIRTLVNSQQSDHAVAANDIRRLRGNNNTVPLLRVYEQLLDHLKRQCQQQNEVLKFVEPRTKSVPPRTFEVLAADKVTELTPLLDLNLLLHWEPPAHVNDKTMAWGIVTAGARVIDCSCFDLSTTSHLSTKDSSRSLIVGSLANEMMLVFPKERQFVNEGKERIQSHIPSEPTWHSTFVPGGLLKLPQREQDDFFEDVLWNYQLIYNALANVTEDDAQTPLASFLANKLPSAAFRPVPPFLKVCHIQMVMKFATKRGHKKFASKTNSTVKDFTNFVLATEGNPSAGALKGYALVCDWMDSPLYLSTLVPTMSNSFVSEEMHTWSQRIRSEMTDSGERYLRKIECVARLEPEMALAQLEAKAYAIVREMHLERCYSCKATKDRSMVASLCGCTEKLFCRSCAVLFAHSLLDEGKLTCDCNILEIMISLQQAVKDMVLHARYVDDVEARVKEQKQFVLFKCPNTTHAPFYAERPYGTTKIYCQECKYYRCATSTCGSRWHPKCPCSVMPLLEDKQQFENSMSAAREGYLKAETIQHLIDARDAYVKTENLLVEEKARSCPHCQRIIIKVGGCNSMICGSGQSFINDLFNVIFRKGKTVWYSGCAQKFDWDKAPLYASDGDGGYGERIRLIGLARERQKTQRTCTYCGKGTELGNELACANCETNEFYCLDCIVVNKHCIHDDNGAHVFSFVNEEGLVL